MEKPVLSDPELFPDDEVVFNHLGKTRTLWKKLFVFLNENFPDLTGQWKYYNDGKSWLMRVTYKSKTIFWLSVIEGSFRTTFYYNDKARNLIYGSSIDDALKNQFNTKSGLRAITIVFKDKNDIKSVNELIKIKLALK